MTFIEVLFLGIGVSMDAFAVAVTNGIATRNQYKQGYITIPLTFGLFQGAMISIGYAFGQLFASYIEKYDHYIAFALLGVIGSKMIYDTFRLHEDYSSQYKLSFGMLLFQGLATSIDALAVGISLSVISVNIVWSAGVIAIVTALFSLVGFFIGKKSGSYLGSKSGLVGGIILILIGCRILITHIL